MTKLPSITSNNGNFTDIIYISNKDYLFLGTNQGTIEVRSSLDFSELAIIEHVIDNEFGEPIKIIDPVVNLSSTHEQDLVYAFFGTIAYCISVEELKIIQKVPISEQVVYGNIGTKTGEIGVITVSGYLSRWSPQFVERISSMDFPFELSRCILLHDSNETRIILIMPKGRLILANLDKDPYIIEYDYPDFTDLYKYITFTKTNNNYLLIENGALSIFNLNDKPSIPHDFSLGRSHIENQIREFIKFHTFDASSKKYISNFRLLRQSHDRYLEEIKRLKIKNELYQNYNSKDDGKTIYYAINDLKSSNIEKNTTARSVIKKISSRHNVAPNFILFSHKKNSSSDTIIHDALHWENKSQKINKNLKTLTLFYLLISFLLLLSSEFINGNINGSIFSIFTISLNFTFLISIYMYHRSFKIPKIIDIKPILIIILILCIMTVLNIVF
tara:strand:- start:957 stop:2288 length:1332 start_codon:yes stop_codon:yes gene_type:complete